MPSTYAHYRFGQMVLTKLSTSQQQAIGKYRQLYDIGLHGPDIVFYYRPIINNPICASGYTMHRQPGRVFFEKALEILNEQGNQEQHLAYLYGFLCHFALDAKCHPYVENYRREHTVSHTKIEVNFDHYLLLKKGFEPLKYQLISHIFPSLEAAEVIAPYFAKANSKAILKALKSMNFYHHLLHCEHSFKRQFLYWGMDLVRQANFKDHIMTPEIDPACHQSNKELTRLLIEAIDDAYCFIQDFDAARLKGIALPKAFNHTFEED